MYNPEGLKKGGKELHASTGLLFSPLRFFLKRVRG